MISDIELPAPEASGLNTPEVIPRYTLYDMTVVYAKYETLKNYVIGMFGGVKIIQYVKMIPEFGVEGGN